MSKAVPIPIQKRTSSKSGSSSRSGGGGGGVSASMPIAPVIGSLPPPSQLSLDMPDLSLPASTPEALSLAEVATAETTQRLVGVSSAPALSYIEQARRKGYPGTSPTVLSVLQLKSTGDLSSSNNNNNSNTSKPIPSAFLQPLSTLNTNNNNNNPNGSTGGLSAMLKGRNDNSVSSLNTSLNNLHLQSSSSAAASTTSTLYNSSANTGNPSSLPKHTGMVLATSFRDPAHMPPPLPEDLEGEEDETSSDEDSVMVARRRAIANHTYNNNPASVSVGMSSATIHNRTHRVKEEDEEDDDDDDHPPQQPQTGRHHATNDDEVFESDL